MRSEKDGKQQRKSDLSDGEHHCGSGPAVSFTRPAMAGSAAQPA
jgi:hypothetical protein